MNTSTLTIAVDADLVDAQPDRMGFMNREAADSLAEMRREGKRAHLLSVHDFGIQLNDAGERVVVLVLHVADAPTAEPLSGRAAEIEALS